jgi:hypothetical protein
LGTGGQTGVVDEERVGGVLVAVGAVGHSEAAQKAGRAAGSADSLEGG